MDKNYTSNGQVAASYTNLPFVGEPYSKDDPKKLYLKVIKGGKEKEVRYYPPKLSSNWTEEQYQKALGFLPHGFVYTFPDFTDPEDKPLYEARYHVKMGWYLPCTYPEPSVPHAKFYYSREVHS